jgi:hypothetical protein
MGKGDSGRVEMEAAMPQEAPPNGGAPVDAFGRVHQPEPPPAKHLLGPRGITGHAA